jgi:D-alanine-D-alanine ligase
MFPQMWAATGVSYGELVDRLITEALSRPIGLR